MISEKWKILITKENIDIIGNYYHKKLEVNYYTNLSEYRDRDKYLKSHNKFDSYILTANTHTDRSFRAGSTDWEAPIITTEQFIKLTQPSIQERIKKLVI